MPFLNLLLAGIVLNLVFWQRLSLWPCIGLHAGWVLFRQTYAKASEVQAGPWSWLMGTGKVIDGLLPAVIMAAVILWLLGKDTAKPEQQDTP